MSNTRPDPEARLDAASEWLADRALTGIGDAAALTAVPSSRRLASALDESLELTAAAVDLALFPPRETPPAGLRAKVTARLERISEAAHGSAPLPRSPAPPATAPLTESPRWGWYAAAVAVAIAAFAWWPNPRSRQVVEPATPDALRLALLETPSTRMIAGACTDDPLCAAQESCGDIVWNPERGEGYLHLVGLEPNDPQEFQYQLWIVDATRDERFPIDGGVFDIPADRDEVVVPIHAALPVGQAALFAVSVEKPGGTVVSDRRFVLVAPVG